MKLTLLSENEAIDENGGIWHEVAGTWLPEKSDPAEVPEEEVHPALACAREARELIGVSPVESAPPNVLWELSEGDGDLYRHAMIEAGHVLERDSDLPPETCPVCGYRFIPVEA